METNVRTRDNISMTRKTRVSNPARTSAIFQELLPSGIATAELVGDGDRRLLLPGERKLVGAAVPKRVSEFVAGRLCARAALAHFGVLNYPVVMQEDRRPWWPDHLVGSITHTHGYSAAAVAQRSQFRAVGIDAEKIGRVSREIWAEVLIPAEQAWLETLGAEEQAQVAALIFSAKEAFYKCQYEVTAQWLDFNDVTLDFIGWNLGAGSFSVRPLKDVRLFETHRRPVVGRFAMRRGLVLTAITLSS